MEIMEIMKFMKIMKTVRTVKILRKRLGIPWTVQTVTWAWVQTLPRTSWLGPPASRQDLPMLALQSADTLAHLFT